MGNIREIRPGASQEPDPNPLGPKATVRSKAMQRSVRAFQFVFEMPDEHSDQFQRLLYGNFRQRDLEDDRSFSSRFVDHQLALHSPFTESVEKFQTTGEPLTDDIIGTLTNLLPLSEEDPENVEPFEPNPVLREIRRSMKQIGRETVQEMERISAEYIENERRIVESRKDTPSE